MNDNFNAAIALLEQVAGELTAADGGNVWTVAVNPDYDHFVQLVRAGTNEELHVGLESKSWQGSVTTLNFSGSIPYELNGFEYYNEREVKASVSATRDARSIARDVARRVLPGYREQLAQIAQRKEQHDDWLGRRNKLHRRMAAAFKANAPQDGEEKVELLPHSYVRSKGYSTRIEAQGYIHTSEDNYEQVSLTFNHIDPELAEELLKTAARHLGR